MSQGCSHLDQDERNSQDLWMGVSRDVLIAS